MLLDYFRSNKNFLTAWAPIRPRRFYTVKTQRAYLRDKLKLFQEGKEYRFYIFKKSDAAKIIGAIELMNIVRGVFLSCHLGYGLDKDEINKGYMTEALNAVIRFVFDKVKLHRIEANVMPRNKPSIRIVEKLGFKNEGLARKYLKINGKWEDHIHFVVLNKKLE
jgi:ribosomal-protein-alanine N-acetyltransferase